jgi:hypothetical protein
MKLVILASGLGTRISEESIVLTKADYLDWWEAYILIRCH